MSKTGPKRSTSRRSPRARIESKAPSNTRIFKQLIRELGAIREEILRVERRFDEQICAVHPAFRISAQNLVHYIALRRNDIRNLQEQLASLGVSSLGRTESHVLAGMDAVLWILHQLTSTTKKEPIVSASAIGMAAAKRLLDTRTQAMLGPRRKNRSVRIMVTMPGQAANDYDFVHDLLMNGMDCMRINCAHDDAKVWADMVANLKRAEKEVGRPCRLLMDLAGPKLRTGPIDPASQIVKWRPRRDRMGRVVAAARIWMTAIEKPSSPPSAADGLLQVPGKWIRSIRKGDRLGFVDARGKRRFLEVQSADSAGAWTLVSQTTYLAVGRDLSVEHIPGSANKKSGESSTAFPFAASDDRYYIPLKSGDTLVLARAPIPGRPASHDAQGSVLRPAVISCTLPNIFSDLRPNERIWFDDGKIGGVIETADSSEIRIRITVADPDGAKLRGGKGINLPDSRITSPALTEADIADLSFVARHADLVGLSFLRTHADVHDLQMQLRRLGAERLGIVLKIETATAFEHLPDLLLTAMRSDKIGVMIARGDLAVECGYERLAEVQEEILWFCEAAHVPVIWATQVLESLAKRGIPSRAEITDAAMGERADCVMLNKGPHLVDAVRVLDNILQRMEAHQSKKSPRLRQLRLSMIATSP